MALVSESLNEFKQGIDPYKTMKLGAHSLKKGDTVKFLETFYIYWVDGYTRDYSGQSQKKIIYPKSKIPKNINVSNLFKTSLRKDGVYLYDGKNFGDFSDDGSQQIIDNYSTLFKIIPRINEFKQGINPYKNMGIGSFREPVVGDRFIVTKNLYWQSGQWNTRARPLEHKNYMLPIGTILELMKEEVDPQETEDIGIYYNIWRSSSDLQTWFTKDWFQNNINVTIKFI
jgi:hypothetical protein